MSVIGSTGQGYVHVHARHCYVGPRRNPGSHNGIVHTTRLLIFGGRDVSDTSKYQRSSYLQECRAWLEYTSLPQTKSIDRASSSRHVPLTSYFPPVSTPSPPAVLPSSWSLLTRDVIICTSRQCCISLIRIFDPCHSAPPPVKKQIGTVVVVHLRRRRLTRSIPQGWRRAALHRPCIAGQCYIIAEE